MTELLNDSRFAGLGIVDLKSGRGNLLASTDGTAAGGIQATPLLERKTTLLAGGSLHNQTLRVNRLLNMYEMVEDVSFFKPGQFGNLAQIEGSFFQSFRDLFS